MDSLLPDLHTFPHRLAACEERLTRAQLRVQDRRAALAEIEDELTAEAAANAELTSDFKRRAYVKREKMEHADYNDVVLEIAEAEAEVSAATTDYNREKRMYEVAKLSYERGTAAVAAGASVSTHSL